MRAHFGVDHDYPPSLVEAAREYLPFDATAVKEISDRGEFSFYVFESRSVNQDGEEVCVGTWTNIVRGG